MRTCLQGRQPGHRRVFQQSRAEGDGLWWGTRLKHLTEERNLGFCINILRVTMATIETTGRDKIQELIFLYQIPPNDTPAENSQINKEKHIGDIAPKCLLFHSLIIQSGTLSNIYDNS